MRPQRHTNCVLSIWILFMSFVISKRNGYFQAIASLPHTKVTYLFFLTIIHLRGKLTSQTHFPYYSSPEWHVIRPPSHVRKSVEIQYGGFQVVVSVKNLQQVAPIPLPITVYLPSFSSLSFPPTLSWPEL